MSLAHLFHNSPIFLKHKTGKNEVVKVEYKVLSNKRSGLSERKISTQILFMRVYGNYAKGIDGT